MRKKITLNVSWILRYLSGIFFLFLRDMELRFVLFVSFSICVSFRFSFFFFSLFVCVISIFMSKNQYTFFFVIFVKIKHSLSSSFRVQWGNLSIKFIYFYLTLFAYIKFFNVYQMFIACFSLLQCENILENHDYLLSMKNKFKVKRHKLLKKCYKTICYHH